jgi:hypothetical protein
MVKILSRKKSIANYRGSPWDILILPGSIFINSSPKKHSILYTNLMLEYVCRTKIKIVQILLKSEVLNSEVLLVHLKNIESLGYVQISKYPCGASIFGDKTNCFIYNPNSMCLVAGFFACW